MVSAKIRTLVGCLTLLLLQGCVHNDIQELHTKLRACVITNNRLRFQLSEVEAELALCEATPPRETNILF